MCCDDAPIFKSVWWLAPSSILINILCCWLDIDQLPLFSRLAFPQSFFRKASYSIKFGMFAQFSLLSLCFQILYWECSITKSVFWMNYELSHKSSNAKLFLMTWMRHDRNCKSSGSYNVLFSAQNNTQKNNGWWPN